MQTFYLGALHSSRCENGLYSQYRQTKEAGRGGLVADDEQLDETGDGILRGPEG